MKEKMRRFLDSWASSKTSTASTARPVGARATVHRAARTAERAGLERRRRRARQFPTSSTNSAPLRPVRATRRVRSSISVLDSSGQAPRVRPMAERRAARRSRRPRPGARRRDLRAAQLRRVAPHHRPVAIQSRGRAERHLGRREPRAPTRRLRGGHRLRAEREDRDPREGQRSTS